MEFGWDDAKRQSNIAKHGLDFADVYPAFSDKTKVIAPDNRVDYRESRYNMLAKINGRICNITFTERGDVIWLISARKANQREQRRYAKR